MLFFCFKQKTAYELRISDWSSDVCSSDLGQGDLDRRAGGVVRATHARIRRDRARSHDPGAGDAVGTRPYALIRHPGSSPGSPRLLKCRSWHGIPAFAGMTKFGNLLLPSNDLQFPPPGGPGTTGRNSMRKA